VRICSYKNRKQVPAKAQPGTLIVAGDDALLVAQDGTVIDIARLADFVATIKQGSDGAPGLRRPPGIDSQGLLAQVREELYILRGKVEPISAEFTKWLEAKRLGAEYQSELQGKILKRMGR
jgi:hypothetical protein